MCSGGCQGVQLLSMCIPLVTRDLCSPFLHSPSCSAAPFPPPPALFALQLLTCPRTRTCSLSKTLCKTNSPQTSREWHLPLLQVTFFPSKLARGTWAGGFCLWTSWSRTVVVLGSMQVGLMVLVVPLRSSLPSVCGPEVPEMNLPPKSSAQPVQLMHLFKKRGVFAQVLLLIEQKLRS